MLKLPSFDTLRACISTLWGAPYRQQMPTARVDVTFWMLLAGALITVITTKSSYCLIRTPIGQTMNEKKQDAVGWGEGDGLMSSSRGHAWKLGF